MILSLNWILAIYGLVALAVLLLTLFSKSHNAMNVFAITLPASYVLLTLFTLVYAILPGYSLGETTSSWTISRCMRSSFPLFYFCSPPYIPEVTLKVQ